MKEVRWDPYWHRDFDPSFACSWRSLCPGRSDRVRCGRRQHDVPRPTAGQVTATDAGDRLIPRITSLKDGDQVDLARALDVTWERAVVMEAYMSGDEMNEVLGFVWCRDDDWAGSDESQRTLAFANGRTVVAEVMLSPDTFRMVEAVESFDAFEAVFVARRDESGVVFLYRP